jgi:hypothetical protein
VQGCKIIESLADALVRDGAHRASLEKRSRCSASSGIYATRSDGTTDAAAMAILLAPSSIDCSTLWTLNGVF